MTHRHDLRWGNDGGRGLQGGGEERRGKIWGNCNSIINKIYLKKKKVKGFRIHSYKLVVTE